MTPHVGIAACVALVVYGQIVLRWQLNPASAARNRSWRMLLIASAMGATSLRAVLWIWVLSEVEVSYAYPFMSLAFVLIFILGVLFLNEEFSVQRLIGSTLITAGVVVIGAGH